MKAFSVKTRSLKRRCCRMHTIPLKCGHVNCHIFKFHWKPLALPTRYNAWQIIGVITNCLFRLQKPDTGDWTRFRHFYANWELFLSTVYNPLSHRNTKNKGENTLCSLHGCPYRWVEQPKNRQTVAPWWRHVLENTRSDAVFEFPESPDILGFLWSSLLKIVVMYVKYPKIYQ